MSDTFYRGTLHWEEARDNGTWQPKSRPVRKPYSRIGTVNAELTKEQTWIERNANRSQDYLNNGGVYYGKNIQVVYVRNFYRTYERTTGWEDFKP